MKIGVIGTGHISDIYLQNMINRYKNLEVLAVASRSLEHARAKAEKYGIQACTVQELLENPEIEMVVNLTPASVHYELIRDALLHGKHVYTEKIITDSLEKSIELYDIAEKAHLYLGSAPDTFLGSSLQKVRAAIDSGLLGQIHSFAISANRDNNVLLSAFSFLREPNGGLLFDYGVYYVTALVSLLGSVARVGGVIGSPYKIHVNVLPESPLFGKEMDTPNESQVCAVLMMESGITGTLHMDADCVLEDQAYFAIYGTKGIVYLADPNGFGGEVYFHPTAAVGQADTETALLKTAEVNQFHYNARGIGPAEMADAIEKGRENRTSKSMVLHVQEILSALMKCGETGGFVDLQTRTERPAPFTNEDLDTVL